MTNAAMVGESSTPTTMAGALSCCFCSSLRKPSGASSHERTLCRKERSFAARLAGGGDPTITSATPLNTTAAPVAEAPAAAPANSPRGVHQGWSTGQPSSSAAQRFSYQYCAPITPTAPTAMVAAAVCTRRLANAVTRVASCADAGRAVAAAPAAERGEVSRGGDCRVATQGGAMRGVTPGLKLLAPLASSERSTTRTRCFIDLINSRSRALSRIIWSQSG